MKKENFTAIKWKVNNKQNCNYSNDDTKKYGLEKCLWVLFPLSKRHKNNMIYGVRESFLSKPNFSKTVATSLNGKVWTVFFIFGATFNPNVCAY